MTSARVRMVGALEASWRILQRRVPELPTVRISVGSGTGPPVDLNAEPVEVFVPDTAWELDTLNPPGALQVLVHEAAHILAHQRVLSDTSRRGRYHNLTFARLVQELNYQTHTVGDKGFVGIMLAGGQPEGEQIVQLTKCRPQRVRRRGEAGLAATCYCDPPRTIRIAYGTLHRGPVTCGICGKGFHENAQGGMMQ